MVLHQDQRWHPWHNTGLFTHSHQENMREGKGGCGESASIYLWTSAAGSWQIQCGPRHAGCCRHSCSSVLPGYTLSIVSHSPTRTPHCLLGSPQRRSHRGPKGKDQRHQHRHTYRRARQLLWMDPCPSSSQKQWTHFLLRNRNASILVSGREVRAGSLVRTKHKDQVC